MESSDARHFPLIRSWTFQQKTRKKCALLLESLRLTFTSAPTTGTAGGQESKQTRKLPVSGLAFICQNIWQNWKKTNQSKFQNVCTYGYCRWFYLENCSLVFHSRTVNASIYVYTQIAHEILTVNLYEYCIPEEYRQRSNYIYNSSKNCVWYPAAVSRQPVPRKQIWNFTFLLEGKPPNLGLWASRPNDHSVHIARMNCCHNSKPPPPPLPWLQANELLKSCL